MHHIVLWLPVEIVLEGSLEATSYQFSYITTKSSQYLYLLIAMTKLLAWLFYLWLPVQIVLERAMESNHLSIRPRTKPSTGLCTCRTTVSCLLLILLILLLVLASMTCCLTIVQWDERVQVWVLIDWWWPVEIVLQGFWVITVYQFSQTVQNLVCCDDYLDTKFITRISNYSTQVQCFGTSTCTCSS